MTLDEIIDIAGGYAALGQICGVDRSTVHRYRHTRDQLIPAKHARKVAEALGIPLCEVRPDLWPPRQRRKTAELVTA